MKTADVFCRVVDNLGDAGVSWRLCRQLAEDKSLQVRLIMDAPKVLEHFVLPTSPDAAWLRSGQITVCEQAPAEPADLVIETFACDVPLDYAERMASRSPQSLWINLEYLSAEEWVDGCHGLPSPHPRLPITRWFFFPGFTGRTGGLLKESRYDEHRTATLLARPEKPRPFTVSVLSYPHASLLRLLEVWDAQSDPIHARIFAGPQQDLVRTWQQARPLKSLDIDYLPWVSQDELDEILITSDFNVVRGEDSFVRAQWAGRPFLWDIYPTDDGAHLIKMAAFMQRYRFGMEASLAEAMGGLWQAWVRRQDDLLAAAWALGRLKFKAWQAHAEAWRVSGLPKPGLVDQLWAFLEKR